MKGFLDYEIWKTSHMLAQNIPLQKAPHSQNELWEEFGPHWCSNDEVVETSSRYSKLRFELLENYYWIFLVKTFSQEKKK